MVEGDAIVSPELLRITHVIAGLGREEGGPSYSVPALAAAQAREGVTVQLRSVGDAEQVGRHPGGMDQYVHRYRGGRLGRVARYSTELAKGLEDDARLGSVLHVHGLWLMANIHPAWAIRRADGPSKLVHSPRGMLARAAMEISAWKKRPVWLLAQRRALEAADCLHATAPSEYEEIRAAGLKNPVAIIPNGVDLPDLAAFPRGSSNDHVALSLGRVHPKKGLDRLLLAWAEIERDFPAWHLRVVGPAERGHDDELRALACSLGLQRVRIEGAVYGADSRLDVYRRAELFVLPTLNENFAMTVAEALAAEVPVISTKGAPWSGLETHGCGWWVDHGVAPLVAALRHAMTIGTDQRHAMGAQGRKWMARDFGWQRVADDMLGVYRWLQTGCAPPSTVHYG